MNPIHTILIANRGEIACRIIRTCQKLGIRSVAVYSDADKNAPFVQQADTAIHIGGSQPNESYLVVDKIIAAAKRSHANAIHPGYGFLSENAAFAKRCEDENIIFIGPHPEAIQKMGSKSVAKSIMKDHGVPTIPGYQGEDQSVDTLTKAASEIGYPVLLKATAGGGGKGMRIVHQESEVENAIAAAKREAISSFGDDEMIIEKYFPSARHIEFQIFGDKHGNAIHVLERECSIQRRYQKIIEESPSPVLTEELREEMGKAAVLAAKALGYDNAGTVEFILSDKMEFFFLEVNTRLQVEHPVTEEVTGLDLVEMQIESAEGRPLSVKQEDVKGKGYAIECRLYAEDPLNDFLPATGKIHQWKVPSLDGLRIDTGIDSNSEVSIYYDPMIAKVIAYGRDRAEGIRKMNFALHNLQCLGLTTNQDFLIDLIQNDDFQKGNYDTHFLQKQYEFKQKSTSIDSALLAATLFRWNQRNTKRNLLLTVPSGWRNNFYEGQKETFVHGNEEQVVEYYHQNGMFDFTIGDTKFQAEIIDIKENEITTNINGMSETMTVVNSGNDYFVHSSILGTTNLTLKERFPEKEAEKIKGGYASPMPAQVVKLLVEKGQEVKEGQGLIVLSSMKMENTICADEAGTVEDIYVEANENIEAGVMLLKLSSE